MGVSVNLFKLEKYQLYSGKNKKFTEEEDWTHVECLYTSMISPSRDLISNTYNKDFGEKFIWGSIDQSYYDELYLSEKSRLNVTRMPFSDFKKVWEKALNEKLQLEKNDVTNETIVCLAQGN
tara:strand:+ start:3357 stop:3722 length:366 start_codon:yes stop_codon:yes gene_type:complete